MSEAEDIQRLGELIGQIGLSEALLLLESGGGSGAMSCCEGREAGEHQDGVEESREDLPRCAGEAEAFEAYLLAAVDKCAQRRDDGSRAKTFTAQGFRELL